MAKILIAEDAVATRELMSLALKEKGHHVTSVPSAAQAQEIIFKEIFDLIVLDVELEEDSGLQVLRKIREINAKIPIVIYSGCVTAAVETEARTAGATDILKKEVGITQLTLQIDKIIKAKDRISQGQGMKKERPILIVDDQENIRNLLKDFFKNKGHDVLEAENGEKACEIARSTELAAILLDIQMPGIDGLETLKRLLEINPNLGIVMATAEQDDDKVRRAIELGAYNYVLKPFDFLYLELVVMSRLAIAEN